MGRNFCSNWTTPKALAGLLMVVVLYLLMSTLIIAKADAAITWHNPPAPAPSGAAGWYSYTYPDASDDYLHVGMAMWAAASQERSDRAHPNNLLYRCRVLLGSPAENMAWSATSIWQREYNGINDRTNVSGRVLTYDRYRRKFCKWDFWVAGTDVLVNNGTADIVYQTLVSTGTY